MPRSIACCRICALLPFPVLPVAEINAVGQPIAAVVATRASIAADAAELIQAEIEPAPLWEDEEPIYRHAFKAGNVAEAFASAAHIVRVTVAHERVAPVALEPRAAMAFWDEGAQMLNVWLSTQTPHRARSDLAAILESVGEKDPRDRARCRRRVRRQGVDLSRGCAGRAGLAAAEAAGEMARLAHRGFPGRDPRSRRDRRGRTRVGCERQISWSARQARLSARALAALQRGGARQECRAHFTRPVCLRPCRHRAGRPREKYGGGRHLSRCRQAGSGDADGTARRQGGACAWARSVGHSSPQSDSGRCVSLCDGHWRRARFRRLSAASRNGAAEIRLRQRLARARRASRRRRGLRHRHCGLYRAMRPWLGKRGSAARPATGALSPPPDRVRRGRGV